MGSFIKGEISDQGLENFLYSFLKLTREDYVANRNKRNSEELDNNYMQTQASIRWFLRTDHGKLFIPSSVDPETIIAAWNKECEYETWRDNHKCRECKNKKCSHLESNMTVKRVCKGFIEKKPKKKVV